MGQRCKDELTIDDMILHRRHMIAQKRKLIEKKREDVLDDGEKLSESKKTTRHAKLEPQRYWSKDNTKGN